jgi:DNA-binding MarR family transcriptional regulator
MTDQWTSYETAKALLESFPLIGRIMAVRMRESGEDEATFMQIRVLMHLREQPITASALAKLRKVSLQSASVLVQGLVERGWLVRIPDPNDRRQWILEVTPEGLQYAQAAEERLTTIVAEILGDLTPEELAGAAVFLPGLRRAFTAHMIPDAVSEEQTPSAEKEKLT